MFRNLNRFLLFIICGFFIYVCIGLSLFFLRFDHITLNVDLVADGFVSDFISNSVFFGLVGAAGVLAQFYGDTGDVLQQRLRRVFANKKVNPSVLVFFEDVAKENAVFAELAEHHVSVLEFSEKNFAYRADFHNKYRLRNAFGDIPYDTVITVEVAPDISRELEGKLAVVTKLSLLSDDGVSTSFIEEPIEVRRDGFQCPVRVSVPKAGSATLELQWWSWVDALGEWDSGFSLKRFAERFRVDVSNKSSTEVNISGSKSGEIVKLTYGEVYTVADKQEVAPRTRVEFFWYPPDEFTKPSDLEKGDTINDILEFDQRIDDPPRRQL